MTEVPSETEQHTLDSASAALNTGDPESLYRGGRGFSATAERLRVLSEDFRVRLRDLESSWHGPGAQSFADAAGRVTHRVEELVTALSEPNYDWLCREMGDALTKAQRELRQQRLEHAEQHPDPASSRNGRGSARDERAQHVMHELANTYRQLGNQLRPLSQDDSDISQNGHVTHTATGASGLDGTPDNTGALHTPGPTDPLLAGGNTVALPAGGVLGKAPRTQQTGGPAPTTGDEPSRATLGRPEAASPAAGAVPVHAALSPSALGPSALGPSALGPSALGRAERDRQHARPEQAHHAELALPGVLGADARREQPSPAEHQPGADTDNEHSSSGENRQEPTGSPDRPHTTSTTDHSGHPDETATPATDPVSSQPAVTSTSTAPDASTTTAPAAAPQTSAHAQAAAAHAPASAPSPPQDTPAALSPGPGGPGNGVTLAQAQTPSPPHPGPATEPPASDPPGTQHGAGTATQHQGTGNTMPPPHGTGGAGSPGGAGGASGVGDGDRERNTWLTERTDVWQRESRSGVLGR